MNDLLDLKQLRYFIQVVESGTMSEAARRCGVSQPAMSQTINDLEARLGEQLLIRGRRGVIATSAGQLLLNHANRLLLEEGKLREQFAARDDLRTGKIVFGMIPTLAPYLLPLLIGEFRQRHPAVEIEVSENRTPNLIQKIADSEMEFAILSDVTAEDQRSFALQTKLLFSEPLLLAVPAQHDWATREKAPQPKDLSPDDLIHLSDGHCLMDQTLKICRMTQAARRVQCDQLETALAMVSANLGMAVVPQLAVKEGGREQVVIRAFAKPAPTRKIFLLKKKGTKLSRPAEELVKVLTSGGID